MGTYGLQLVSAAGYSDWHQKPRLAATEALTQLHNGSVATQNSLETTPDATHSLSYAHYYRISPSHTQNKLSACSLALPRSMRPKGSKIFLSAKLVCPEEQPERVVSLSSPLGPRINEPWSTLSDV